MSSVMSATLPQRRYEGDEYRLVGGAGDDAQAAGLVNADWYKCPVPRATMKALMQREDARAIRDTALWYASVLATGALFLWTWTSGVALGWQIAAWVLYATLYCGPADSRWHECSHGTAFKTRWMNDAVYQIACFQVFRRPTVWRWSHTRHHTDTLVVGRDPEIAAPVPTRWFRMLLNLLAIPHVWGETCKLLRSASGRLTPDEQTFIPEMEWPKVVREARAWLALYLAIIGVAVGLQSWLPVLMLGLPSLGGAWLYNFFGLTQHAGLPENVTDHRLNCRTVHMNPVFRFLYWNMNYHVEHHMFPMVPYHQLPGLHAAMKDDCPPAYRSTIEAYAEIIPALLRQTREPQWHVQRPVVRRAATGG